MIVVKIAKGSELKLMSNKKSVIATDTMGASGVWDAGHLLVFSWAVVTQGFIFRIDICKIGSYSVLVFLCISFIFICVCVCVKILSFSCAYWSSTCLLLWTVCSTILLIFKIGFLNLYGWMVKEDILYI